MVVVFFGHTPLPRNLQKDEEWRRDWPRLKEAEKITKVWWVLGRVLTGFISRTSAITHSRINPKRKKKKKRKNFEHNTERKAMISMCP